MKWMKLSRQEILNIKFCTHTHLAHSAVYSIQPHNEINDTLCTKMMKSTVCLPCCVHVFSFIPHWNPSCHMQYHVQYSSMYYLVCNTALCAICSVTVLLSCTVLCKLAVRFVALYTVHASILHSVLLGVHTWYIVAVKKCNTKFFCKKKMQFL